MKNNKCRVCDNNFFEEPLLHYENMPKAAQYLPDKEALKSEKGVDLSVCQCSGCGLVQLSNSPVPYYKEVIRAVGISEEMKAFRLKQFRDFVEKYSLKEKKVVEIGCGRGEYLSIMQQAGVDAYGLEESAESVKQCVKNGLRVEQGFVQDPADRLKDAPFDAFFMLSFLEHLPGPNPTLRGIYNNLSDDAVGLIEVPNFDMILKKNLFSEFIGDHLFYFTRETLSATLESNGFEVIECKEIWHDYIISAVVRKMPTLPERPVKFKTQTKLDIAEFYQHQAKLKQELNAYVEEFKKVAVWGAGHQALAVLALADLAGRIKYVVDSAPFKQGKYTPATHIPIVVPDMLDSDPVDAIIVMAASYSDEVAKIIQQRFNHRISIAILRDFGLERR